MADKITNFEDYKKKEIGNVTEDIDIQIEDPYNFFNEEEREEYFRERQKEEAAKKSIEPAMEEEPEKAAKEQEDFYEDEESYEDGYEDDDYPEDYPDDEEDEESGGGFSMELFVRISSIITGIIILAFIAMVAKVKIYDRYFAPDPDNEQTVVAALPAGYVEKNDTVVVTAEKLNLRSVDNAQSDATKVASVQKGTELKRIAVSADESWALVEYNGSQVYASMKYLEEKK